MIVKLVRNILEWAAGHADERRFSPVAIVFHWSMAALAFFQLGLGWWMGRVAAGGDKVRAFELHFAIGVLMFVLIIGRSSWRALAPGPINDADKPGWESVAARITHVLFYICLFGLPLSGWLIVSATGREQELTLLNLMKWPLLPLQDLPVGHLWILEEIGEWTHTGLVLTLLALIPVHIVAALKHHFIDRDDVLHGMAPIIDQLPRRRTVWQRRYRAVEKRVRSGAMQLWRRSLGRSTPPPRRA